MSAFKGFFLSQVILCQAVDVSVYSALQHMCSFKWNVTIVLIIFLIII